MPIQIDVNIVLYGGDVRLFLTPTEGYGQGELIPLSNDIQDLLNEAARTHQTAPIRAAGERLFKELKRHPAISVQLAEATAALGRVSPVQFRLVKATERVPWEILREDNRGFFALDPDLPVVRVVRVTKAAAQAGERRFEGELRVAVVLAAYGLDGAEQWRSLHESLRATGLRYRILALVSKDTLHDEIGAEGDKAVEVRYVPGEASGLIREIAAFQAQILYIFAHGAPGSIDCLELETRLQALGREDERLYLSAVDFRPLREMLWLAVVNACHGAAPASDNNSLAFSMVEQGIPAVIGMREEIAQKAATAFCHVFFGTALRHIVENVHPGNVFVPDWGGVLNQARHDLCRALHKKANASDSEGEWTLPVLYVPPQPTPIAVAAPRDIEVDVAASELRELAYQTGRLPDDFPPQPKAVLDRQIRELEERLRGLQQRASVGGDGGSMPPAQGGGTMGQVEHAGTAETEVTSYGGRYAREGTTTADAVEAEAEEVEEPRSQSPLT